MRRPTCKAGVAIVFLDRDGGGVNYHVQGAAWCRRIPLEDGWFQVERTYNTLILLQNNLIYYTGECNSEPQIRSQFAQRWSTNMVAYVPHKPPNLRYIGTYFKYLP